jgi:anti-anti-sigma factor
MTKLTLTRQTIRDEPRVLVVRLVGAVDSDNGQRVDEYMKESFQAEQPCHVLLDFSALSYIPSVMLGSLLFWKDQIGKHGGKLILFAVQSLIADLIHVVGFHRIFTLTADQETALAALAAR